jgi:membrane protein YqaA with SNARE-associated domain
LLGTRNALPATVTVLLGACIGWFFGALIATLFAETARSRGQTDGEKHLRAMRRQVERDEFLARSS